MTPRIGEPRVYSGHTIPVLYPGEQATAAPIPFDTMAAALANAQGECAVQIPITDWLVEPAPGVHAWYLRWRYRLIGQWRSRREGR